MQASHSSRNWDNMVGMELKDGNLALATLDAGLISIRLLSSRGSFEIGSLPYSLIYFLMSLFSKMQPDMGDTTGSSGVCWLIAQIIDILIVSVS